MSSPKKFNNGKDSLKQMLRIEWIGQSVASIFWIGSVFSYGVNSTGDWLQLFAATSWLVANIASLKASQ